MVLPDHEPARAVAVRLASHACQRRDHESGRPWLIGCWPSGGGREVRTPTVRAVVLGPCGAEPSELRSRLARRLDDLPGAMSAVAGSFHLLANDGARTLVQGPVFQSRQVFHTVVGGVPVVTDSARTAAWLADAKVDERRVALRLAAMTPPHALAEGTMWQGVHAVPAGVALLVESTTVQMRRWWRPPTEAVSLREGAADVRQALSAAVGARVRPGETVGADLSGGMDSTSVCFVAGNAGARLVTVTLRWGAAGNEDVVWADRAARDLPMSRRLRYGPDDLPGHFSDLDVRHEPDDEPSGLVRDRAQVAAISRDLAGAGVSLRLSGHGGDHLTKPPLAYLADFVLRRPLSGLQRLVGFRANGRWTAGATTRMLLDRRSYGGWVADMARQRTFHAALGSRPPSWEPELSLPPWASADAAEGLAELLHDAAARTAPLGDSRGQHARLHAAVEAGRGAAQLARGGSRAGMPIASPFCDDAVVEACLRVRAADMGGPDEYKPLLAAAMNGVVPAPLLMRTTKDHSGDEWYQGLRANAARLHALFDDSPLVARRLVDPDRYRQALRSPQMQRVTPLVLESTLAVETWLRDLADRPAPAFVRRGRGRGAQAGA